MTRNKSGVTGTTIVMIVLALAVVGLGAMYIGNMQTTGSYQPYQASSGQPLQAGATNIVVNTADKGLTPAEAQAQAKTGDLAINIFGSTGSAFTDTSYKFYPASMDNAKGNVLDTKYGLNYIYDSPGVAAILNPDGMQAPALSMASGILTLDDYNGKPLILYGYPVGQYGKNYSETIAVTVVPTKLTGLDTPKWGYTIDGVTTTNLQIYNLSHLNWVNPQVKLPITIWKDSKSAQTSGQSMTVKLNATTIGQMTRDAGIFIETPATDIVTRVDIMDMDSGKSVSYQAGAFEATLYASGWKSKSAPALTTTGNTMWFVGFMPGDNLYKSTTYSNGYQVTVYYDHPGTTAQSVSFLWVVENVRSTTTTSGHKDATLTKLNMTLTSDTNVTTGFS